MLRFSMRRGTISAEREMTGGGVQGWFQSLPPCWVVYALTLTETVGAGVLALPIAIATVGAIPGVAILIGLGLINVLTMAAMASAIGGSTTVRQPNAFLGRIVAEYLGQAGAGLLSVVLLIRGVIVLMAYYIGLSTHLAGNSPIPAPVWTVLIFVLGIYMVRRKDLAAVAGAALIVGIVNVSLILLLSALALSQMQVANLQYMAVPFAGGQSMEALDLRMIFGVVQSAFFGHLSVGNSARLVLSRPEGGRALLRGGIAAQLTAIVIYTIWVIAMTGAVDPVRLANEQGTALAPLSAQAGPVVQVLGTVLAVLALGMASFHVSYSLYHLIRERLPLLTVQSDGQGMSTWQSVVRFVRAPMSHSWFRFALAVSPIFLTFLAAERLLLTNAGSFASLLCFSGTAASSMLAGVYPLLMFAASRRQKQHEGHLQRMLRNWFLLTILYLFFVANLFLHGLVLWDVLWMQISVVVLGVLVVGLTLHVARRGIFNRRDSGPNDLAGELSISSP